MADKEEALCTENWAAYQRCLDAGHSDYVKQARRCEAYYLGNQWAPEDKAALDAVKRPALTINQILSVTNALIGEQMTQRAEVTFRPKRHGNMDLADLHTRLHHHILEDNKYRYLESQMFADGIIQDRGYLNVYVDFSENIAGEVRIEILDPLTVLLDPLAKEYDPATWSRVIITRWMTLDEIAVIYGKDKADKLDSIAGLNESFGVDSMLLSEESTFGDRDQAQRSEYATAGNDHWQVRQVRVIDQQYRKLERAKYFVDPVTSEMREVPSSWGKAQADEFAEKNRLQVITRLGRKVRWTVTADHVLLHDDWSPYPCFTVIPYFPLFRRGKPSGLVRHLLDPQDTVNKYSSQILHTVNTVANSGWIIESGSVLNMSEADIEERGATTGLVMTMRPGATPPQKILPNPVPTGLEFVAAKARADLRDISGVEALLGQEHDSVSGVAIQAKQKRAMIIAQVPFDNLNLTRTLLAEQILTLVQRFYTEPRVLHITEWDSPKKPSTELQVNQPDPSGQIVNDLTVGEYSVSVSIVPSRESFDDAQFAEAIQLREAGVVIPDDVVIEYSHLSRRDDIAERVRKMVGGGEPTPEEVQVARQQMQMQMDQAKAQTTVQDSEGQAQIAGAQMQLDTQKLQAQILVQLANLQNKIDLAKLHTTVNLATDSMNNAHKMQLEAMKARLAPKTPTRK